MDETKNTHQFGPGNPGKPKGATNHLTREVKAMILEALEGAGGVQYLIDKADSHPQAFMSLLGRVLPLQVTGKLEHEHSGSISGEVGRVVAEMRALGRTGTGPSPLSH